MSRIRPLRDTPAFTINVAGGDSPLYGCRFRELELESGQEPHQLTSQAGVPFAERLFELAPRDNSAKYFGQITSNSLKREFGKKLVGGEPCH